MLIELEISNKYVYEPTFAFEPMMSPILFLTGRTAIVNFSANETFEQWFVCASRIVTDGIKTCYRRKFNYIIATSTTCLANYLSLNTRFQKIGLRQYYHYDSIEVEK